MAYDDIFQDMQKEQIRNENLAASAAQSYTTNPDEYAGQVKLARKAGTPPVLMPEMSDDAKMNILLNQLDSIKETSPATVQHLSDPANLKAAHDDVEILGGMENLIKNGFGGKGNGSHSTLDIATQGDINTAAQLRATLAPFAQLSAQSLEKVPASIGKGLNELAYGFNELVGFNLAQRAFGVERPGSALLDNIDWYNRKIKDIELYKPKNQLEQWSSMATDTIAANAPLIPFGAGGPKAMLSAFVATAPGNLEDYLSAGYAPAHAALLSLSNKAMEGLTEMIGFGGLFKPGKLSHKITEFVGKDLFGEEVNTLYSWLMDKGTLHPETTTEDLKKQMIDTAVVTVLASGGQVAMAHPFVKVSDAYQSALKAKHNETLLEALGEGVKASKLRERLPDQFQALVSEMTKDGPVSDVYIPVEKFKEFFQSMNVDPGQMAEQVLSDPTRYHEALATGSDVAIPLSDYVSKLAGTEYHKGLIPDLKFHLGEMSLNEAQAFMEDGGQGMIDDLITQADDAAPTSSDQKVYEDVFGQLIGMGHDRSRAAAEATQMQSVFRSLASREGLDAHDLYQQYGLKVTRPLPDVLAKRLSLDMSLDPLLETLRSGKVPTDTEINGQSLVEFLRQTGVKDYRGELKNLDPDTGIRGKKKKLIRDNGLELDKAREAAVGEGFLPEGSTVADFLDAIDGELRGNAKYAAGNLNEKLLDDKLSLEQLKEYLDVHGVDVQNMGNEEIRKALNEATGQGGNELFQSAWHGSPHDHDGFKLQHIGSGEGNQAFGWGLYFAEDKAVAEFYKEQLSKSRSEISFDGEKYDGDKHYALSEINQIIARAWHSMPKNWRTKAELIRELKSQMKGVFPEWKARYKEAIAKANSDAVQIDHPGKLYKVDLAPSVDDYLAWDKPLNDQSPQVKEALKKAGVIKDYNDNLSNFASPSETRNPSKKRGDSIYEFLAWSKGGPEAASRYLLSIGIPGLRYQADSIFNAKRGKKKSFNVVIFDDSLVKIEEKYQKNQADQKRGYLRYGADRQFEIGLFEKADLSTFLHESGHFYFEIMADLAEREGASEGIKSDYATLLSWMGAADRASVTTEHHELFARGFEAYLMEGKAPSAEMCGVFQRFKSWLVRIYKDVTRLNVPLNDEVRAVFDRLVSTEDEIEAARKSQGLSAMFATAEDAGMSAAVFKAYRATAEAAGEQMKERLTRKLMNELTREQKAWWKQERTTVRGEVETEAKHNPVYEAFHVLTTGETFSGDVLEGAPKLSRDALVKMYGEAFVKKLPRTFFRLYSKEGGIHPDIAAEILGFSSGDEMIKKMVETPPLKKWVEAETDFRMRQQYGDALNDGSLADEALVAVHSDLSGQVLRAELEAIARKAREIKPIVKAAVNDEKTRAKKEAAYQERWNDAERRLAVAIESGKKQEEIDAIKKELADLKSSDKEGARAAIKVPPASWFKDQAAFAIASKEIREINPNLYSRAEQSAAKKAVELAAKKQWAEASAEQSKRLLNHYLFNEATTAREEAEEIYAYARKMMKGESLAKLGKAGADYMFQVQGILEMYGFEHISNKQIEDAKLESLDEFMRRISDEEGVEIPVDGDIVAGRVPNYKEATIEELRSMRDAIRAIEMTARRINSIQMENEKILFDEAIEDAVNQVNGDFLDSRKHSRTRKGNSWLEEKWKGIKDLAFVITRPQFIIEALDAERSSGFFHSALWTPYNNASATENRLKADLVPQINQILDANPEASKRYREKIFIESLDESLEVYALIGIVLNMGNESNLDKLQRGGLMKGQSRVELTAENLQEIIDKLGKSEMDMIQQLWNLVGSLRPEMAAMEKRMFGIEPEWVTPQELRTRHGVYAGGYWPVVFDSLYSKQGGKQEQSATIDEALSVMPFTQAFTKRGHLKSRTQAALPMLFEWHQIASRHLDQAITDIAYREFIIQASKIMRSQPLKNAIIDRVGEGYHGELNAWLKGIVDREQAMSKGDAQLLAFRNAARTNATVAYLGLKVANAVVDMAVTPMQAWSRVEAVSLATGIRETVFNHEKTKVQIQELSPYMAHLWQNMDRDLSEGMKRLAGKHTMLDRAKMLAMESRQWAYELGAQMIWRGAYLDATNKRGMSAQDAVKFSDDVVRGTSDAGRKGDLNSWERSKQMRELTMFMGPATIAVNSIAKAYRVGKREGFTKSSMPYKTLIGIWLSNGLLYELLLGRGPGEDDDKEKWTAWALAKFILFPLQAVPFARDLGNMVENKLSGEVSSAKGLPLYNTGEAFYKAADNSYKFLTTGEHGKQALKNINMAVGLGVGLPASQLNITGEYIYDVLSGDYSPKHAYSPLTDIFFRRKSH